MSPRSMEQLFSEGPLNRCFLHNDHLLYLTSLKRFSQKCFQLYNIPSCTMNLVSSFTDDFLFISFKQKNEIKKRKYPNGIQIFTFLCKQMNDLFDMKLVSISKEIR